MSSLIIRDLDWMIFTFDEWSNSSLMMHFAGVQRLRHDSKRSFKRQNFRSSTYFAVEVDTVLLGELPLELMLASYL